MTPIPANIAVLRLCTQSEDIDDAKLIGCTTGDSINFNTDIIETTSTTSSFSEFLPTYKSGEISSDTVLIMTAAGDNQLASTQLLQWHRDDEKLKFSYEWIEGTTHKKIKGNANILTLSISAPAEEFISVALQLKINGQWELEF